MTGRRKKKLISEGISQMKARHYEEQGDFKELKRVVIGLFNSISPIREMETADVLKNHH